MAQGVEPGHGNEDHEQELIVFTNTARVLKQN